MCPGTKEKEKTLVASELCRGCGALPWFGSFGYRLAEPSLLPPSYPASPVRLLLFYVNCLLIPLLNSFGLARKLFKRKSLYFVFVDSGGLIILLMV